MKLEYPIEYAHSGATNTDLLSGWDFTSGWGVLGTVTINDKDTYTSTGAGGVRKDFLTIGKLYKVTLSSTVSSGYITIRDFAGSNIYLSTSATPGVGTAVFTAVDAGIWIRNSETAQTDVATFTITELGATLILSPEGMISQSTWRDYYHSIDVAVGTGATSPRLVKSWAGMNAWRFNGTTSVLSKTGASDGLTGDITISGWIYPFSYGEGGYGQIFYNTKAVLRLSVGGERFDLSRDGITVKLASSQASGLTVFNQWYHIVVTSTSTGVTNFYVNGVLSGTANQDGGVTASGVDYYVGNNTAGSGTFDGVIEGFKITKGIWSAEQIALDYAVYND